MVLAATVERMLVGLAVLEVQDDEREPFRPAVGPIVAKGGLSRGDAGGGARGGCRAGGGLELQQLAVEQHVAGTVQLGDRPCADAAGYYPGAEGVVQILKEELFGRTCRFLTAGHVYPFLELHGLAGGVYHPDCERVRRSPAAGVGAVGGEGKGEAVFGRLEFSGRPIIAVVLHLPGDVGARERMAGIGFHGALYLHARKRETEFGRAVEHEVEGRKHEVVDQYIFAAEQFIAAADLEAVVAQTLATGEEELSGDAAVRAGGEGQLFDGAALHVFQYSLDFQSGRRLHGVASLPDDGLEMNGFLRLEGAAVGKNGAVHFVGPVGDVGRAVAERVDLSGGPVAAADPEAPAVPVVAVVKEVRGLLRKGGDAAEGEVLEAAVHFAVAQHFDVDLLNRLAADVVGRPDSQTFAVPAAGSRNGVFFPEAALGGVAVHALNCVGAVGKFWKVEEEIVGDVVAANRVALKVFPDLLCLLFGLLVELYVSFIYAYAHVFEVAKAEGEFASLDIHGDGGGVHFRDEVIRLDAAVGDLLFVALESFGLGVKGLAVGAEGFEVFRTALFLKGVETPLEQVFFGH